MSLNFDRFLVDYFDSIRKTKHMAIYDEIDIVTKEIAIEVLENTKMYVQKIRAFVLKSRTN